MLINWRGSFVETEDLSVHYVRAGSGRPVVFLHGWPEFARTWLHNLPVLAQEFDCIAPEFRGFGETAIKRGRREGGTPPQLLAQDLRDFLDALGLGPVDIVSHDVGSFVAQAEVGLIEQIDRSSKLLHQTLSYLRANHFA